MQDIEGRYSSVIEERYDYLKSPYFKKHEYSDFRPFYVVIGICTVIGLSIFLLNIVLGCCSRYSGYWNDRHTGNRWIVSLWTSTPRQQPALDYTELETVHIPSQQTYYQPPAPPAQIQYTELQKKESDI